MIYKELLARAKQTGGADIIGVVSSDNTTAVMCGACKPIKKYFDGSRQEAQIIQITAMGPVSAQEALVDRICEIMTRLVNGSWEGIEGVQRPKCTITSKPVATTRTERSWIYMGTVEVKYYTKEVI